MKTAIHEAAHAAVVYALGGAVREIEIFDEARGVCRTYHWRSREMCAVVSAAGWLAEARLFGDEGPPPGHAWGHAGDLEAIERTGIALDEAEAKASALLDDPRVWSAVEFLARALLRRGRLDGRTAMDLLADQLGD